MHELEPGGIQVPPSRRETGTSDRRSTGNSVEADLTEEVGVLSRYPSGPWHTRCAPGYPSLIE
jgi:hypothetical protein